MWQALCLSKDADVLSELGRPALKADEALLLKKLNHQPGFMLFPYKQHGLLVSHFVLPSEKSTSLRAVC